MRGLILKDIFNMKREIIGVSILALWFCICPFYLPIDAKTFEGEFLVNILFVLMNLITILICSTTMLSSFNYDEKTSWSLFERILPVKEKSIVSGKYIVVMGCVISMVIVSIISNISISLFSDIGLSITSAFLIPLSLGAMTIIQFSIMLPIIYKFGIKYSFLVFIACGFLELVGIIALFILCALDQRFFESIMGFWIYPICIAVSIASIILSINISNKILIKKVL